MLLAKFRGSVTIRISKPIASVSMPPGPEFYERVKQATDIVDLVSQTVSFDGKV